MRPSRQIINNFFYDIKEDFILNTLYVLRFIINVYEHKSYIEKILSLGIQKSTVGELYTAVEEEIQHYENISNNDEKYLMTEITTGKAINVIKDTPIIWCFIALYWSYDFKLKNHNTILKTYNSRIGDIALKFLLYFLKMKHKEAITKCAPHKDSFYQDLSARLVRIIDILPAMYAEKNEHLNKLYFPIEEHDLAQNFLLVQINNQWEQSALLVKEEKPKNIIRYKHDDEGLHLIIKPSRMTKEGAFRDLDKTYNQLIQLYNLDAPTSKRRYEVRINKKATKQKIQPTLLTLENELIYEDEHINTNSSSIEENHEYSLHKKVYRRDIKSFLDHNEDNSDDKTYVIPNAFQQHKKNVAFSSALSKQKLLLTSDYDIPTPQHQKSFCASLPTSTVHEKVYTGFYILAISMGCTPQYLLSFLLERKECPIQYKDSEITVNIDGSIFANHYSTLLDNNEHVLRFSIHSAMSMLIVWLKRLILEEFDTADFLDNYRIFIKHAVKKFPKRITIKWKQTHRYLAQYLQENGNDVLTAKLATSSYMQSDTAKLAYTSSRSNAVEHSRVLIEYWHELNLDTIVKKIIDINVIPASNASSLALQKFTGSSQGVNAEKATSFFMILSENIFNTLEDQNLHFNLVSIYSRYAMSILAATRPFKESGNFTSYHEEIGLWFISEKAQDIASGTRLVPICDSLKSILHFYQGVLKAKGLEKIFYLTIDEKHVPFTSYYAHKFIEDTTDLADREILQEFIKEVPLNTGRHIFVRKAVDELVNAHYISAYLGHYSAGEEHFGIYSTLNFRDYCITIKEITTKIAKEYGIKEL